jgi:hypothetical protein
MLCDELAESGAIIERKELGLPRRATICADPPPRFAPFAAANFKEIKSSTEFKFSDLRKDILTLCSTVCFQACVYIANAQLGAKGVPIDKGREGRPIEIHPTEITGNMVLGESDGALYQGATCAWKSVEVRWDNWVNCFSDTEAVRSVAAHFSQLAPSPSQQLPSLIAAPKRKRSSPERARAATALAACYPKGTPDPASVPNVQLLDETNNWLASQTPPMKKVELDSLLRAAGRRKT